MRAHICAEGTMHCCVLMCMRVCRISEYWNAQLKVLFFIFISAPVIYITKSHQNWHSFRNTKLLIVFCKGTIPLATNMILHFEMSFTFWITARQSPFTNISSRQTEATDMGPESRFYNSFFCPSFSGTIIISAFWALLSTPLRPETKICKWLPLVLPLGLNHATQLLGEE